MTSVIEEKLQRDIQNFLALATRYLHFKTTLGTKYWRGNPSRLIEGALHRLPSYWELEWSSY